MSNSIKVSVLGAVHMKGKANKGAGAPYDFANLSYFVDSQSLSNDYMQRTVAGREVTTVSTSKDIVEKLSSLNFPIDLDLVLSPDPQNIQRNIVTGFSVSESPKVHDPLKKFGASV